jgi:translation initiation factor IF-3
LRPPPTKRENEAEEVRINERIRVPRVLVIDDTGNKLGEFLTQDALALAREKGFDLVEVAPNARPPVCRFLDFGRLKYDKKKKEALNRKNQVVIDIKEIKLRPKTDQHDFDVKVRHTRRFLEDGDKVKITVRFRGREIAHREIGEQQCQRLFEAVQDLSSIAQSPKMDGRQMVMLLNPERRKGSGSSSVSASSAAVTPVSASLVSGLDASLVSSLEASVVPGLDAATGPDEVLTSDESSTPGAEPGPELGPDPKTEDE